MLVRRMINADLIERTLERVVVLHGDPKSRIYQRLFQMYPKFEELFVMDTDGGVRGSMLESSLDCLIGVARSDTHTPRLLLEAARLNHDGFGISDEELDGMFVAMRDVFREILGNEWTADVDAEWEKLLAELATIQQPN